MPFAKKIVKNIGKTRSKNLSGKYSHKILDHADHAGQANLKSEVDKLDENQLEKVQTGLNSLRSKAFKLDVDKLVPAHADLIKLSDVVKNLYNAKTKDWR